MEVITIGKKLQWWVKVGLRVTIVIPSVIFISYNIPKSVNLIYNNHMVQLSKKIIDIDQKLKILGESAQFDLCGACATQIERKRHPEGGWIYPAVAPDGKRINLLKILLSNDCIHNCYYCGNREGRSGDRSRFSPEELVRLFLTMGEKGLVRGLFLSSAVDRNPFRTMEDMLKVTELLRLKHHFSGYIHLKILPESTTDYIDAAVRLATRVSINIEAPGPTYLKKIAPQKNFNLIWNKFLYLRELAQKGITARAGFTTQLVVGGSEESDQAIMKTVSTLYRDFSMNRAYYSAFHPISRTPLADKPPESTWREHRLYQADFLFRKYCFGLDEFIFNRNGNLPLETDPKTLWALNHPEFFPIEINTASYQQLLRIPGIGPISAQRIVHHRKENHFHDLKSLQSIGIRAQIAAPYILLSGKRFWVPQQLSLFPRYVAG